jgi:hypothetical protein
VAGQIYSDYMFTGILTGPSEARHQQAAWWFLISFSTGGCYSGNTARVPHEEMSACNDLSGFSELNKIVCALCALVVVQVSGLFIIGSDAYCNFLIHIINFSQSISHSYQRQLLSSCKRLEVLNCSRLVCDCERF